MNGDLSESSQSLVEESAEAEDTMDSPVQRKPPARYGSDESFSKREAFLFFCLIFARHQSFLWSP